MGTKRKIRRTSGNQKKNYQPTGTPPGQSQNAVILQQARAHYRAGRFPEAEALYRQILQSEQNHADALNWLGRLAHQAGNGEKAVTLIGKALVSRPDYLDAHINMGIVLTTLGRLEEAAASYRQVLALKPDFAEVHCNLGNVLKDQGKLEEAADSYRRALSLKPDFSQVHNNLGILFEEQGWLEEAVACYRRALLLMPNYAEAHINLGLALKELGELEDAIACFREAIALQPDVFKAHNNLLFCLNLLPEQPVALSLDETRNYGREVAARIDSPFSTWHCSLMPNRLRIGLVSGDLRNHPVGYFLESILPFIASGQLELIAYSTQPHEDALTARIRPSFVAWKSLLGMSDADAARLIWDDEIHILLDLSGYTCFSRLLVFARKPAPIQAAWLGYFASTGIAAMDYIIADPVSVPAAFQEHFTEQVWYLPETRLCFSPPAADAELPTTPLPALQNGYITFGCFQNLAKLNDEVLTVWGEILRLLPQARLRVQNSQLRSPAIRERLPQRIALCGIAPERVTLEKSVPRVDYLAAHAQVDIILDTFPFPGGTTTCEALWMGVPTMTLRGQTMLGRQGASMLSSAGLTDWIAKDERDYVAKAVAHASDIEKLARLRAGLRQHVIKSPLFDSPRFAKNFETAMWGMWRRFQEGQ